MNLRFEPSPPTSQSRATRDANPAGQRIGVGVTDIGGTVVEIIDVEGLVDELRLWLEQPAAAKLERISTLE